MVARDILVFDQASIVSLLLSMDLLVSKRSLIALVSVYQRVDILVGKALRMPVKS